MARRRTQTSSRTRRSAPRRPPVRSQIRTLARAVTFEPRRIAIPADPPSVPRTITYNNILACRVEVAKTTGFDPEPSETMDNPLIGCGLVTTPVKSVATCVVKLKDVFTAWCHWMRVTPGKYDNVEICLTKVQYWGMSPTIYSGIEVSLNVDFPAPFSGQSVRDSGTTNARPRCGISMPVKSWEPVASATTSFGVDPDSSGILYNIVPKDQLVEGFNLGVVYISVSVRVSMYS